MSDHSAICYQHLSDEALVTLANAHHDERPLNALLARYRAQHIAMATWMLKNSADAHDVVQSAHLNIFRALHTFEPTGSFRAWAKKIVYNAALMHQRAARSRPHAPLQIEHHTEERLHGLSGEHQLRRHEQLATVRHAMSSIPDAYARPLSMMIDQDMSLIDIGAALDLSVPAVKTRLHRARHMVLSHLGADFLHG
jgi:RNA polymerase sigma-70 factor (ECF subfamily)